MLDSFIFYKLFFISSLYDILMFIKIQNINVIFYYFVINTTMNTLNLIYNNCIYLLFL